MKKFYVAPELEELEMEIEEALLAASEIDDITENPIDPQPADDDDYQGW